MTDWDVMMARFPAGTFQRIDAVSENRSEFVRAAVEVALSGSKNLDGGAPLEDRVERLVTVQRGGTADDDRTVLLALVKRKPLSERSAMSELGWMELRVSKVAAKLATAGLIRYRDGLMEAT